MLGLEFYCFDVVGDIPGAPYNPIYRATAVGLILDGRGLIGRGPIYSGRILVDNTCPAIQMIDVFNVELDQIQTYTTLGVGISLNNVKKSTLSKVKVIGGKGVTNARLDRVPPSGVAG